MKHQVKSWMSKHPIKIDKYEDIKTAKGIMLQEGIRHLLVFDSGLLSGVLSETDLLLADSIRARFKGEECKAVKITVGDLMARGPTTVSAESSMTDAVRLLAEKHFRSLPVVDSQGKVCGILTETDVLRYALVASQSLEVDMPYVSRVGLL